MVIIQILGVELCITSSNACKSRILNIYACTGSMNLLDPLIPRFSLIHPSSRWSHIGREYWGIGTDHRYRVRVRGIGTS